MPFGLSFSGGKKKYNETTNTSESGNFNNTYNTGVDVPDYWQGAYQSMLNQYVPNAGLLPANQNNSPQVSPGGGNTVGGLVPPPANQNGPQMGTMRSGGHQAGLNAGHPGLSSLQGVAANNLLGNMGGGNPAVSQAQKTGGAASSNLMGMSSDIQNNNWNYWQNLADRGAYTMGTVEQKWPELYQRSQDVSVDPITAQTIDATQGHNYSDPYLNKYLDDHVGASLQDFDVGTDRLNNARRARQSAMGAWGDRTGMYNAIEDSEAARNRGALSAGLRFGAQDRAFGFGQQDAGRQYDANKTNVSNDLMAQMQTAQNSLAGQQFNANLNQQRNMFDVNAAYQGQGMQMDALQNMQNNILNAAGIQQGAAGLENEAARLKLLGQGMDNETASLLFGFGNTQFSNPFNLLGLGTSTFGEYGNESGTYASQGTSNTKGKGSSFGASFTGGFGK